MADDDSHYAPKVSLKDIFKRFRVDYNAVRNQREQRELFEKFLMDLEKERLADAQLREYDKAEVTKAMVKLIREELRKLAIHFEEKRQNVENRNMEAAGKKVLGEIVEAIEDEYEDTQEMLYEKELALHNLQEKQLVTLERDIADIRVPRARYSKRTLELRHAEKLLSQQQDYFNAARVRIRTKELEAKEDKATKAAHEAKMQAKREVMWARHDGERKRLFEDVKKARAVATRTRDHKTKVGRDRVRFLDEGMKHGHTMHKHKVLGSTHNIELEPRKPSKETTRGTTYKDKHIGKTYMAIPSLCATHVFDAYGSLTAQKQVIEEARPRTASPVPNFRDPAWRMTARLEATRPASRAVSLPDPNRPMTSMS